MVRPHLAEVLKLTREAAAALSGALGLSPYDALMDGYQQGIGADDVAPVFVAYDVALYYFANSAAAPNGLTITITAVSATYLQGGPAEYSGVATVNPLDQVVIANGSSTSADSGLTPAVGSGELVYGGMVATNGPGTLTPGTSQGVTYVKRAQSTSGSQGEEDIVASAAGQQHAGFTFANSTAWFMVCAVFKAA